VLVVALVLAAESVLACHSTCQVAVLVSVLALVSVQVSGCTAAAILLVLETVPACHSTIALFPD